MRFKNRFGIYSYSSITSWANLSHNRYVRDYMWKFEFHLLQRILTVINIHIISQHNLYRPYGGQPFINIAQPFINTAQLFSNTTQPFINTAQPLINTAQPFANCAQPFMILYGNAPYKDSLLSTLYRNGPFKKGCLLSITTIIQRQK